MDIAKLLCSTALICVLGLAPAAFASGGGSMGGGGMSAMPEGGEADPAAAYQAGVAALQAHRYTDAIHQFRIAQHAAPSNGAVNYALGVAYLGANDKTNARDSFRRSISDSAAPPGAHLQLALVSLDLGDRNEAVTQQNWAQQALANCTSACDDQRRAQLQAVYDQISQALTPPTPATTPNPTTPSTSVNPATTGWNFPSLQEGRRSFAEAVGLLNQARYEDALAALQRTQDAVGPHPDILTYMGFANRKLGRYEQSFAYYRQALGIDPNNLGVNEYLGELYVQLGDMPHARQQLAKLDQLCAYGCAQREELAHWIQLAGR
jgi:tetratricopeptide (TPR) repeat protein